MTRIGSSLPVFVLACSTALSGSARAEGALSLAQVLASTQRHHPEVERALKAASVAEGEVMSSLGGFDPRLTGKGELTPYGDYEAGQAALQVEQRTTLWGLRLIGGWEIGRGDIPLYKKEYATSDGGKASLGVELPLLQGGGIDKVRARLWSARHRRVAARLQVTATSLELARRAAHAYWVWVAAGHRLKIAQQLLAIAEKRAEQIAVRIKRGALPPIEEIENQRAILKRQGAVIKARRSFEKAALKLSLYLRDARGAPVVASPAQLPQRLAADAPIPGAETLAADLRHALEKRPELAILRASGRAVEVDGELAENARLPKLDLSARGSYDAGSEPYETRRVDVIFGFSFSFPMLVREARGKLQQARGKKGAIEAKRRLVADKIGAQVRDVHSALRAARQALRIAEREVKVAHRVEEAERERLRLGSSTLLMVNIREQASAEAEVRAINAAAALQRSLADRRALTARGFADVKGG